MVTHDLTAPLREQLATRHATTLLHQVELPVQRVLTQMERSGIATDQPRLDALNEQYAGDVRAAAERAYAAIITPSTSPH